MNIYERAKQFGAHLEDTCVSCGSVEKWNEYMKGHTRANRREVVKIAVEIGAIDEHYGKIELKNSWFNPYNHFKTKTHIIYVNSGIEHFIKVNQYQ